MKWGHDSTITVNGAPVPPASIPYGYEAALAPNTKYLVELPASPRPDAPIARFEFTTGPGAVPLPQVAVPKVDRVTWAAERPLSPECTAVLRAIDCFDVGPLTHAVLETAPSPLFWLIEQVPRDPQADVTPPPALWPASCGHPEITEHSQLGLSCDRRYRLRAVGVNGDSEIAEIPCGAAPGSAVGETAAPAGGCALAPGVPGGGLFALVAVALGGVWRRRRRGADGARKGGE